jgi:hypothetical protein
MEVYMDETSFEYIARLDEEYAIKIYSTWKLFWVVKNKSELLYKIVIH